MNSIQLYYESSNEKAAPAWTGTASMNPTQQAEIAAQALDCQVFARAASQALPLNELDAQAFGSKTAWGTSTRPGRTAARVKAIRFLVRAANRALEADPALNPETVAAGLASFRLRCEDCLISPLHSEWISTKTAIKHRGEEITRAIIEAARCINEAATEGGKQ